MAKLPTITTLDELCALVAARDADGVALYVRFSRGPAADRRMGASTNHAAGRPEAGLSVNNLVNEHGVWEAGHRGFTAMALREYSHFPGDPYLVTGAVVGEGSDGEPVLANWRPVALVDWAVVTEAMEVAF